MLMVQQHLRTEMLRRQAIAEQLEQQNADANSDDETVIMEEQRQEEREQQQEENPWGPQF